MSLIWERRQASRTPVTRSRANSRSNVMRPNTERHDGLGDLLSISETLPPLASNRGMSHRVTESASIDEPASPRARPFISRASTAEGPPLADRETSPAKAARMTRIPSDSVTTRTVKPQVRNFEKAHPAQDLFRDDGIYDSNSSPDRSFSDRIDSPSTSYGSTTVGQLSLSGKRAPPPPPPSRAKKPPAPPVPVKKPLIT